MRGEDKKLIVKDVGPYVYTERTKKVNVVYNDNNTISYQVYIIIDLFACLTHSDMRIIDRIQVPN